VASSSKSAVVLPSRKAPANLLSAGTKRTISQRDGYDDPDAPEKDGPDVKWTAEGSHVNAALDILAGDEAEELLAKRRRKERLDAGMDDEEIPDDGQYRGQNAYHSHLKKSSEVPKAMRVGPQRSTSTIRTVTIVDYQPDVCKDYKGMFRRFPSPDVGADNSPRNRLLWIRRHLQISSRSGDVCVFLVHPARLETEFQLTTDLAGWQLDKLAENPQKQAGDESDSDDSDEDVPFACLICRKHYTDPIVTRCGHYFCSACAIKRFAKTPKCLACGAPTGGIFNRADKILEKINKKKQDKEEKKAAKEEDASPSVEIEGLETRKEDSASEEDSESDDD
jgi:RING finger protein 113A